ncbi:hypothetical protein [Actinomadura yumaensis]|uniref:Uncharacterized protein n=1 Tax=Actinomadura yumaensis TaxID=111807 RepID=A0ABW2CR15_9ACTN
MPTPLTRSEISDPARLAARAAKLGLPGQRSKTAIVRLRRERSARAADAAAMARAAARPVAERLIEHLTARYTAEIWRRGGETGIQEGFKASALRTKPLTLVARRDRLAVLHVDGWRYYSRRHGSRRAALSYLCGVDDAGPWAVRVPGTIVTVADAVAWVIPAEVTKAPADGRQVRRQGDVYAVETTKRYDTPSRWVGDDVRINDISGEPMTSHYWNAATRTLVHRPLDGRKHRPLRVNDLSLPGAFTQ